MIGSIKRTFVIASHTFTQLVRMKAFGFLAAFAVILIGINFFDLPTGNNPMNAAEEELRMLKSSAMGAMSLFAIIFAIAATGLLLPRDLEDRTLYTILCKPVPRIDYLAGKYLGVLWTIFVALLLMDILLVFTLKIRVSDLLAERLLIADRLGWSADEIALEEADVRAQGPTWSVQAGIFAIFLKAMVTAGVALLISTFSRSTLFTIIIGFLVYFIGHFAGEAREFWLSQQGDVSPVARYGSHLISIIFPDYRLYNIIDGAIAGSVISSSIILTLMGISSIYAFVYLILSWFTFAKKEF